jgi:anti-sigma regulatory factor (Ser/Thr protein kinase)
MSSIVKLSFAPLPAHVRTARLVAAAVGRRSGLDEALLDEVKLAVGEACSRAVALYASDGRRDLVHVEIEDGSDTFEIRVSDIGWSGPVPLESDSSVDTGGVSSTAGNAVDAVLANDAEPTPQGSQELSGVLGLAVIAGLVDDVYVEPAGEPGASSVRMQWRLPERGSGTRGVPGVVAG